MTTFVKEVNMGIAFLFLVGPGDEKYSSQVFVLPHSSITGG